MTTKRTHGPCTCWPARAATETGHAPDCPALYPAQQEPDALTRLARLLRGPSGVSLDIEEQALALISDAREEQRRASTRATNTGIERVAKRLESLGGGPLVTSARKLAKNVRDMKDPEQ